MTKDFLKKRFKKSSSPSMRNFWKSPLLTNLCFLSTLMSSRSVRQKIRSVWHRPLELTQPTKKALPSIKRRRKLRRKLEFSSLLKKKRRKSWLWKEKRNVLLASQPRNEAAALPHLRRVLPLPRVSQILQIQRNDVVVIVNLAKIAKERRMTLHESRKNRRGNGRTSRVIQGV
jgi:hypothetical protein